MYFSLIIAIHGAYGNGEIRVKMARSDMSMVYMPGFPVAMLDFQRCSANPDIFTSSGRTPMRSPENVLPENVYMLAPLEWCNWAECVSVGDSHSIFSQ